MDLSLWSNRTITIDYRWGSGDYLLLAYGSAKPRFTLLPKYIPDHTGKLLLTQFQLGFAPGYMIPNWQNLLLTPLGSTQPDPPVANLPPWDGSSAVQQQYEAALTPLYDNLITDATTMQRLEAYLPVAGATSNALTIDRIRMIWLAGAVVGGTDLVMVAINVQQANISLQQNGGGSGPPSDPP